MMKNKYKQLSKISEHKKEKKKLNTPLNNMGEWMFSSWINERLPDILWAALLVTHFHRANVFEVFAHVIKKWLSIGIEDPTISGLTKYKESMVDEALGELFKNELVKETLRPLLLFEKLPYFKIWEKNIGMEPDDKDIQRLKDTIAKTLNFHSNEATRCCWLKVSFQIETKKVNLVGKMNECIENIEKYQKMNEDEEPEGLIGSETDKSKYTKGLIRSLEQAPNDFGNKNLNWPEDFWNACYLIDKCEETKITNDIIGKVGTTIELVGKAYNELIIAFYKTIDSTKIEPKRDSVFGFGFYSLSILRELMYLKNSSGIIGRMGLRSIVESYITLSYLNKIDEENLWKEYRNYGNGQAKLAFLKLYDKANIPDFVNIETLHELANEDRWQEFQDINFGSWAQKSLRKISEEANCKELYDIFYDWTSGYLHGHWAAVKDSVFTICNNPLHRFHRIPLQTHRSLEDILQDSCLIVDKILEIIEKSYPDFRQRVTLKDN
jgi:hypothetical protein